LLALFFDPEDGVNIVTDLINAWLGDGAVSTY
jgi:hypothetical protein